MNNVINLKENVGKNIVAKMPTGRVISGKLYELKPNDFTVKLGVLYISLNNAEIIEVSKK